MKKFNLFLIGLAAMGAVGCSSDEPKGGAENGEDTPRVEIELSRGQQEVVNAQNGFALRLFNQLLSTGAPTKNHIVSPLSLSLALSMTANGAAGTTLDEIYTTLGYEGATSEEVNSLARVMMDRLPAADGKTRLAIANSMWINSGLPVLDSFKQDGMKWYDAEIANLKLNTDDARHTINKWISNKTEKMIPEFLKENLTCKLALINTLYFKSTWSRAFDAGMTKPMIFNNISGGKPLVKMMDSGSETVFRGCEDDGAVIVTLPYGNGTFSMTLILPPAEQSLSDFASTLTETKLKEWMIYMNTVAEDKKPELLQVMMPKFKIEASYDMIEVMKSLGMKSAFYSSADFSRISPASLMIETLKQKNIIEVDEAGTKIASVTDVEFGFTSPGPLLSNLVVFDRPFIYMITEESTGAILFMGTVAEM